MRVRATRLGVTGCNARKRGINIAALFAAYPGRAGAYWGKSFSDNLAKNRQALGPELSPYANGFNSLSGISGVGATPTLSGTELVITSTSADGSDRAEIPVSGLVVGATYLIELRAYRGSQGSQQSIRTSTAFTINTTSITGTAAPGQLLPLIVPAIAESGVLRLYSSDASGAVGDQLLVASISIKQIADWSKIVQFTDPNGTVPWLSVFQAGAGLGLVLDQSKGLVRGPALTPDAAALNGGATVASGWYTAGAGASVRFSYLLAQLVQGSAYEVFIEVSASTGTPSLSSDWCDGLPGTVASPAAGGMYHFILPARPAGYDATYRFLDVVCGGSGSITFRVASFCALPGNHLQQPTAAARGELSARYNQVPSSGNVTLWQQNGTFPITVTPGGSPSGGDVSTSSVTTGTRYFQLTAAVGMSYRHVACVRPPNPNLQQRMYSDGVGGPQYIDIVPATGAFVASGGATGLAEAIGGGWYRLTATYPAQVTAGTRAFHVYNLRNESVDWGDIDVRLVDDAIASLPAFQAVRSATDYDDVGFPVYWRTQTDDGAYTDIDPAGATKALVFAAVQKMSDAAQAILVEHTISNANDGSLSLQAPSSAAARYAGTTRGTTATAFMGSPSPYSHAAPERAVLRLSLDNSAGASAVSGYRNGVLALTATDGSTGTSSGTYVSARTYIGSRAGTSRFANARWFALPLVMFMQPGDPGLTASQIAQIERQMAGTLGVTL